MRLASVTAGSPATSSAVRGDNNSGCMRARSHASLHIPACNGCCSCACAPALAYSQQKCDDTSSSSCLTMTCSQKQACTTHCLWRKAQEAWREPAKPTPTITHRVRAQRPLVSTCTDCCLHTYDVLSITILPRLLQPLLLHHQKIQNNMNNMK